MSEACHAPFSEVEVQCATVTRAVVFQGVGLGRCADRAGHPRVQGDDLVKRPESVAVPCEPGDGKWLALQGCGPGRQGATGLAVCGVLIGSVDGELSGSGVMAYSQAGISVRQGTCVHQALKLVEGGCSTF